MLLPAGAPGRSSRDAGRRARGSSSRSPRSASGSATATSSPSAGSGEGRALIRLGEVARGDDAARRSDGGRHRAARCRRSSSATSTAAVIDACHETFDLRRAQEWTAALARWCESQPDASPYRGHCMIHRAEIMQLHGEWPDALDEAERACERLSRGPPVRGTGQAWYALASSTVSAARLERRRSATGKAVGGARSASRACAAPAGAGPGGRRGIGDAARGGGGREPRGSARPSTWPPASRSCSPRATSARPARRRRSWPRLAETLGAPFLRARRRRPPAPCFSPRASRAPRSRPCARPARAGGDSRRLTRRRGPGCSSASPIARWATRTPAGMELDAAPSRLRRARRRATIFAGSSADAARPAAGAPGSLTAREIEVLRLVATGRTNRADRRAARHQREDRRPAHE